MADEGRNMWMSFPTLFKFSQHIVPEAFKPTDHIFYRQRCMDIKDGRRKWSKHQGESELIADECEVPIPKRCQPQGGFGNQPHRESQHASSQTLRAASEKANSVCVAWLVKHMCGPYSQDVRADLLMLAQELACTTGLQRVCAAHQNSLSVIDSGSSRFHSSGVLHACRAVLCHG